MRQHNAARPDSLAASTGGVHDRRSGRVLAWSATALAAVLLAVTLLALYLLRVDMLAHGVQETQADARLIAAQTARSFQTVDQRLQLTAVELARRQAAGVLDAATAQQVLRQQIQALPFVQATWTLDAQGRVEFSSQDHMPGRDQSGSDFFQIYRRDPATAFHLGKPERNAATGAWQINAARPLHDADGKLRGVIVASVTTAYFLDLWTNTLPVAHSVSVLFHRDGTLLMRSPHDEAQMGRDRSDLALFTQRLPASLHGDMRTIAPLDGVERLLSYVSLDSGLPLVLVAGSSVDSILAPWRRTATVALSTWAAACVVMLVVLLRLRSLSRLRARADDQVRQAELDREQVFARISDAFVALDADWRYTHVNTRAGEMFGRDPQSLIGKHIWTEFPEGRGQKFHLLYEQAMADQTPRFAEEYYPPYDRWYENRIYPAPDGLSIYFHDITDRKKSELDLAARERRLRRLIDGMGPAIFVALTAPDGSLEHLNRAGELTTEKPLVDLLGVPVYLLEGFGFSTAVQAKIRAAIARAADGAASRFDVDVRAVGGTIRTLDLNVQPLQDDAGVVDHLVLSASDITDRVTADTALAHSKKRFEALVENSIQGIVVFDGGKVSYVNPAYSAILARPVQALTGVPISDYLEWVHPDDRAAARQRQQQIAREEPIDQDYELRMLRPDGQWRWVRSTIRQLEPGHSRDWFMMSVDIHDGKLAELALRDSEQKYRVLIDHSPYAIVVHMLDRIVMANAAAAHLFGASDAAALAGCLIDDLTHPDYRESSAERRRLVLAERDATMHQAEIVCLTLDGRQVDVQVSIARTRFQGQCAIQALVLDIGDRKQAERALAMSERQFRAWFDASALGVGITLMDGRCLQVNPALCRIVGYDEAQLRQMTFMEITYPEDLPVDLALMQDLLANRIDHFQLEKRYVHKQGHVVWVDLTVALVRDADGQPIYTVAQVNDITAHKQIQTDLQDSQQQFQALAEHSIQGIVLFDVDGIQYANPAVSRVLGYSGEELLAFSAADMLALAHPEDQERARRHLQGMQGREPVEESDIGRMRHKDGSWRWVQVASRSITLANRASCLSMFIDVHDRKLAEDALRDSEELFRSAFTSGDIGMIIVDLDGRLMRVNPAFCQIVGYSEAELLQLRFHDITHVDDLPASQVQFGAMSRRSRTLVPVEKRYRRKDGELVWCKLDAATVCDALGQPQFHVAHVEDISQHKLLADKLRRSEARLRATLDALPDLMFEVDGSGTYHDFHSPRQDLLMVAPEKFLGTRVPDILPPDVSDSIMDGIRQALVQGRSNGQRYQLTLPSGMHWFELSSARKATMPDEGERVVVLSRDISDRVQFEQSLRYNEELLRQMAETISQVFWLADLQTQQFLYASPSFEPLLGFPPQALLGRRSVWLQHIHPDDRALVGTQQAMLPATGSYDMQFRICPPGQEQRWIHARAYPIRDDSGKLYRSTGVIDDITGRKLLEIREDNERQVLQWLTSDAPMDRVLTQIIGLYEGLLAGMLGSIQLLDEAGQHLRHGAASNLPPAYRDAIDGIAIGPSVGSCGTAAYTGETVITSDIAADPLWAEHTELALAHGLRACWSVPIKGASGRVFGTVSFYFGQIRTPSDAERAIVERAAQLVGQPIERALAARQLRVSEERYRALVEWSPLGIAVHQDGLLVYVNPAFIAIFGALTADQLLGRNVLDLIVPQEQEAAKERIARILAGETTDLVRRKYCRLDGSVAVLEGRAGPITINGQPAVQFSVRDVTDELAAQTALVDSRQQLRVLSSQVLRAQEAERRRIAHELHDELGQSLTAIKINLLAGQRAALGGDTAIATAAGAASASENIRIVESALAHVRGLALALRPSMLDDLGLLPALRWLASQVEQRNNLAVHVSAPPKAQRFSPDLETACFRVAQEATTNVVRHAHAANVNIDLRVDDGTLELTIRDDGIGFDVAAMRARAVRGGSVGVLGMQERASLVGGHLVIDSTPGAGSMVRLSCRLDQPEPTAVPGQTVHLN